MRLLCRLFDHRYRPMLTRSFWAPVVHACTRCGTPAPTPQYPDYLPDPLPDAPPEAP